MVWEQGGELDKKVLIEWNRLVVLAVSEALMAVVILVFSPSLVHIRACFETKFIKSKPPRDCM